MQHFVRFLVDNWYILLEIFLLLLSVIFFILKKPTNKVVSGLFELIYKYCIEAINQVEISNYTGKQKLEAAVSIVIALLQEQFPMADVRYLKPYIKSCIEDILTTPTKKGGLGREKEVIKKS